MALGKEIFGKKSIRCRRCGSKNCSGCNDFPSTPQEVALFLERYENRQIKDIFSQLLEATRKVSFRQEAHLKVGVKKVYWLSGHNLTNSQVMAIKKIHGDVEIIEFGRVIYRHLSDLVDIIDENADGFCYAVAPESVLHFALRSDRCFGFFRPAKDSFKDNVFKLGEVFHCQEGQLLRVWVNPRPAFDSGGDAFKYKKQLSMGGAR